MKKLTSIALILLLFLFTLINITPAYSQDGRDWTGQECQKQRISATYTGKSQSAYCREQEEFGSIVGFVFKWFIILFFVFFIIMAIFAFSSSDVDNKPKPSQKKLNKPKLTPKELEEKQARQKENKKKRSAKQKAELDKMTKIINENKAKKNKKK
jgi:uncharacterized integral membrane protein